MMFSPSGSRLLLAGLLLVLLVPAASAQPLDYPPAPRVDHTDTYHGVAIADPYRWMEDLADPALHAWMHAQDDLRAAYLADSALVQRLYHRIAGLTPASARSAPTQRGSATFYYERTAGQATSNLFVAEDPPRLLLDLDALNQGEQSASVGSFSPHGRYLTLDQAQNQSRWQQVQVHRVADGVALPEVLTGYYSGRSTVAWTHDEAGFFYVRYPVPDDPQAPLGVGRIFYHRLGTPQEEDRLVYERPEDPALRYGLRVTRDGRYLVVSASTSGSFSGLSERIFYRDLQDPDAETVELFPGLAAGFSFEGNSGRRFWIRTTHEAPRMRLVGVSLDAPAPARWQMMIPEREGIMQNVSEVGQRLVVLYIEDARTAIRIFDHAGTLRHEPDLLAPSLSGAIWSDNYERDETYFGVSSIFDPATIYRLDVLTGEKSIYTRPSLPHNPDDFVIDQVFYTSTDGTRVPMFLVHRKDLRRDGQNPVFMYGYGAWSWSAFPWQRHLMPWVEMGGIYAVPNIRGGGEYGEAWHQAGIGRHKQTGIDDYIAAAEWLIENDYTTPERMVANGGSASGLLPAVAVQQRPDLFGAAVINFPALDKLRYLRFGSANSWVSEFGDPDDPDDFAALRAYSPYHTVEEGRCYPPTWIQVGENDDTTTPMHGYKYAAALQAAQGCDHPILLKIAWGAGHSYGLNPAQSQQTQAEELAFLIQALDLPTPDFDAAGSR